ncbi:MAG: hypothetical protein AAGJ51_01580 [Pseudomonadota bacterium]
MKLIVILPILMLANCASDPKSPTAEEIYEELITATQNVMTGAEFMSVAIELEHECTRQEHANSTREYVTDNGAMANNTLVCRWDEPLSGVFDVVFGTAFSVIHLDGDQIVERDIKVIYTGP